MKGYGRKRHEAFVNAINDIGSLDQDMARLSIDKKYRKVFALWRVEAREIKWLESRYEMFSDDEKEQQQILKKMLDNYELNK